jgi:thioredoxin-related protein
MKKLLVLMLAIALFASFTTQETPKKVFIQSIENKIEVGTLAKNRNLVFGFKNILLENLQELNYDVTDSAKDADYSIKVELLYFDVLETNSGFSVFHKSDNETVLRVKGYLYNKDGKKIKEFVSVGKSSEISMSTLIISEGGGINQTSVSNVIKKSSETLILNLFKK